MTPPLRQGHTASFGWTWLPRALPSRSLLALQLGFMDRVRIAWCWGSGWMEMRCV